MFQKMVVGIGFVLCGLLMLNIWTIQNLESRIAILEAEQATGASVSKTSKNTTRNSKSNSDIQLSGAPKSALNLDQRSVQSSNKSAQASVEDAEHSELAGAAILRLDDPEVKEVFDDYLDEYLKNWQQEKDRKNESGWLDHMSTTIEVFCEESNLSEETQELIVQRAESAHEEWEAVDRALESGQIDRRELQELHKKIEKEVTEYMHDLIGKESWEKLAERIWG